MISERSVLLDRYDELVATTDPGHLRARFADRVVLAIDGLQPEVGHEWVIRDCLSGAVVLARALLSSTAADLTPLLCQAAESVGVPVSGSDGQRSIRTAVALPGVPHQLSTICARRRIRSSRPTPRKS
jgi:hypothetical protein